VIEEAVMAKIIISDLPKEMKISKEEIKKVKGGALLLPLPPALPYYDYVEIRSKNKPASDR
jgi:hypothetical protein